MSPLLDAFWRAAAYCLHPRVIFLSLLPLVLMGLVAAGVGYWLWSPLVESVRSGLDSAAGVSTLLAWFEGLGLVGLKAVLAPLLVVLVVTPVVVVVSLLVAALVLATVRGLRDGSLLAPEPVAVIVSPTLMNTQKSSRWLTTLA